MTDGFSEEEFNERELRRSIERDRDNQQASFTRAEKREIMALIEERRVWRRARTMTSALAKWIVLVGAAVTAGSVGWGNFIKWLGVVK